jgi:hypothetical protein
MTTSRIAIYEGMLCYTGNGEESRLLGILPTSGPHAFECQIFADIASDWTCKEASVRYFISDVPATKDELESDLVRVVCGACKSRYGMHYSEITGYLWTDEDFNVGGHDLIAELRSNLGKFLYMEVEYRTSITRKKKP